MTVVVSDVVIVRSILLFFINLFLVGHACYSKAYGPLLIHPVTNTYLTTHPTHYPNPSSHPPERCNNRRDTSIRTPGGRPKPIFPRNQIPSQYT